MLCFIVASFSRSRLCCGWMCKAHTSLLWRLLLKRNLHHRLKHGGVRVVAPGREGEEAASLQVQPNAAEPHVHLVAHEDLRNHLQFMQQGSCDLHIRSTGENTADRRDNGLAEPHDPAASTDQCRTASCLPIQCKEVWVSVHHPVPSLLHARR